MLEDEQHLKKVGGRLTCDDKAFDKIFPPCSQQTADISVGRIVCSNGLLGTGTLIESDGIHATGITAKHVLFKGGAPTYGQFYQCSMRVGPGKVNCIAELIIDEVLIDPTSQVDIALFKGTYKKKASALTAQKLSEYVTPVAGANRKRKHIKIHHYPLGIEDQRENAGELDDTDHHTAHYVSTLPGSSGAPILTKDGTSLVGIHTGAGQEIKKVKYTGKILQHLKDKDFRLSDNNKYERILKKDLSRFTKSFKQPTTRKRGRR